MEIIDGHGIRLHFEKNSVDCKCGHIWRKGYVIYAWRRDCIGNLISCPMCY